MTLHGLRHSHAGYMLASNIHPKMCRKRLGRSSIAITMNILFALDAEHAGRGRRSG